MKKTLRAGLIGLGVLVLLLGVIYGLLGVYYMGGFPCFTWINGVYCTGKTVNEVNQELIRNNNYDGVVVLDNNGARLFVGADDCDMTIDYRDSLYSVFNDRNPLYWGVYVFKNLTCNYEPTVTVNKDKIAGIISDWEIFVNPDDFKCSIEKSSDGYSLENAFLTVPVEEKVIDTVYDSMMHLDSVVDLSNYDECYRDVDLRSSEQEKVALFAKIDDLQSCNVSYVVDSEVIYLGKDRASDFILTEKELEEALSEKPNRSNPGLGKFIIAGEETTLSEEDDIKTLEGIVTDENGNPIISESKIFAFLEDISESHDTSWMMENYREGKTSTVIINDSSKGDGSIFDIDSEFEYLKEEFKNGNVKQEAREFQLSKSAVVHDAATEIGKTYIEINMGEQMLYYYVDGNLSMEMPIVTGNVNRSRGTPTGIYPVYNKRYHTNLVGVDYVSYVNYWLGVHKGVGIHDALWRNKFGEQIYKTDGSHGCINCPLETVEKLWEVVDVGTPVVLYY
ncbi:L,D-transpeptidase [Butyrivibrio sp. AE2032]|uniref:L,D-transpeptidase n=1 Tax=Butyrivibrio sp. AE2032 TaxID=1458463 RepID=UPI0009DCA0E7|nr:L,D-transpeptidase [Butyrivibrio sp. AE2032]